ncbi:MAG: DUF2812 domain-containing protein [Sarcina sp.]
MRIGKYKFIIYQFLPYEYKVIEQYLSEMATKGWILGSINSLYIKFKKVEPKELKYNVCVMENNRIATKKNYIRKARKDGWEYIGSRNKFQIYSNIDKNATDIEFDNEKKLQKVRNKSLQQIVLVLIMLGFMLWLLKGIAELPGDAECLAQISFLGGVTLGVLLIINYSINLILFVKWYVCSKKSLENDIYINQYSNIHMKFRWILMGIVSLLFIVVILGMLLNKNIRTRNIFSVYFSIIIIINIIMYTLKDKINIKRRKLMVIVGVTVIVIAIISGSYLVTMNNFDNSEAINNSTSRPTLSITNFNGTKVNQSYLYINQSSSPIAKYTFYVGNNFQYKLFESDYKWAINYDMKKIMTSARINGQEIVKENLKLPSDIKVYYNHKQNNYVFKSNDKVLEIQAVSGVSPEKLASVVYNKVLKVS